MKIENAPPIRADEPDFRHQDLIWLTGEVDTFLFDKTVLRLYRFRPGEKLDEITSLRAFDIWSKASVVPESVGRAYAEKMAKLRNYRGLKRRLKELFKLKWAKNDRRKK